MGTWTVPSRWTAKEEGHVCVFVILHDVRNTVLANRMHSAHEKCSSIGSAAIKGNLEAPGHEQKCLTWVSGPHRCEGEWLCA